MIKPGFPINWKPWVMPTREAFQSEDDYFEYRNRTAVCEICGQSLQEGEIWGLIPHHSELRSGKQIVECRLVHRSCYRTEQR